MYMFEGPNVACLLLSNIRKNQCNIRIWVSNVTLRIIAPELKDVATVALSIERNSPTELRRVSEDLNAQKYSWEPKIQVITLHGASSHLR